MLRSLAPVVAVLAVLTAGCGGDPAEVALPTAAGAPSAAAEAEPAATETSAAEFATAGGSGELVDALAEQIPTAKLTTAFTEDDDPNDLLGRPGGYVGKAVFSDTRVKTEDRIDDKTDIGNGGGVEVFSTTAEAKARQAHIKELLGDMNGMLGTEYLFVSGPALLRVSGHLTPKAAAGYEKAWPGVVDAVLHQP